ncbi:MAG: hypothetical protein ACR2NY_02125 [Alphaproteobacteria bacterium]
MPIKKKIFQWLKRTVRFNRIMSIVMLWLLFIYGVPIFPIPLILNIILRWQATTAVAVDDIRLRYNILTATPEVIIDNLQIDDDNFERIVIGLNSQWSLHSRAQDNLAVREEATISSAPPSLGMPNYWEEPKSFNVLASNAIFSYVIVRYAAINLPFEIRELLISPDKTSPIGFRLDGFWQIEGYRGKLSFRKKEGENLTLFLTSKKFNLLNVLEHLTGREESIFNFSALEGRGRARSLEEFAVDSKLVFDDEVNFQMADIKIASRDHYLETIITPGEQRTDILLRWDLDNLQTLLSQDIKLKTKVTKINTKGNLALYSSVADRGAVSAYGISDGDRAKSINNHLELLAYFRNEDVRNLHLKFDFLPNDIEEKATDYAFRGDIDAIKDGQAMDLNFKLAKVGFEHHLDVAFDESLQAVCAMFDFCDDLPANLIWGHEFSKVKGNYKIHINNTKQSLYDKFRNWHKIYFDSYASFEDAPDFDIPFMNFSSKANSLTEVMMQGYSYGNAIQIEEARVENQNGLSAIARQLEIKDGSFYKGIIESKVGNRKKSGFIVSRLPDGTRKMEAVGESISLAPYLGFEKDRNITADEVDIFDRHIDRSKLPNLYLVGHIEKLRLHGDYEWRNAKFKVIIRDKRLEFVDFKSNEVTLFYKVGAIGDAVFRVSGTHAGEMLNGLGVLSGVEGGNIKFSATAKNADQPLIGSGEITDFLVYRLGGVAKLFDLLSITGLFSGEVGVPFDKITSKAKMHNRQIIFENGVMTGPSMEMTFAGRLDRWADATVIEGTYVPKNIITSILDNIPFLNLILPMSGDNAVIGTRYIITGSLDKLNVRFNVGTLLTPGILRGVFGQPTGEQEFIERGPSKSSTKETSQDKKTDEKK